MGPEYSVSLLSMYSTMRYTSSSILPQVEPARDMECDAVEAAAPGPGSNGVLRQGSNSSGENSNGRSGAMPCLPSVGLVSAMLSPYPLQGWCAYCMVSADCTPHHVCK